VKFLNNGDYDSLFLEIDDNNTGYIDFNNLMDFLQKNGIFPYEEEVIYILRRLDKDDDGRISLLELQNEISPKESLGFNSGNFRGDKSIMNSYENPLGKLNKSSASKNYPYEPIRKSASPMKSQISKSPLKENSSKLRSHRKDYNPIEGTVNREYREYISGNKEFNSNNKEKEIIYESPKKRLEFESGASATKNLIYSNNNNSPNYKKNSTENNNNIKDMKSEIERELTYSKKNMEFKDLKSEIEREMILNTTTNNKYRSPPKISSTLEKKSYTSNKTPEKVPIDTASYQSLRKPMITEGILLEIAQYLKLIIRCERELQYLRGDLSLRPDYNITEMFNVFDKLMKGYLNPDEIEEFFENFDIFSSQEKTAFIGRFCKTKEIFKYLLKTLRSFYLKKTFSFVDFVNVFQGNQESLEAGVQKNKRQSMRKNIKEAFSGETYVIMKEIVRTLVRNERNIEENSKDFLRKNPVDLKEVFAAVDVNKNGVLSEFEVRF